MNAAERFFEASRNRDLEAGASALAPDAVLLGPGTDDPVSGREAVAGALGAVEAACDEFRHTHFLVDTTSGPRPLFGLVFEAVVGDTRIEGVDLIELDERDRIASFRVAARPMSALMALGSRMSSAVQS